MKATWVALLAFAGCVLAQPPGRGGPANWRFVGAEAGRPGPVVKNAPFSADVTTETTQVLADGNRIHQTSSMRLYRDSEGRTRREQSLDSLGGLASNANLPPVVFVSDPVTGVNYAISPSARTASRSSAGGRGFGGQPGSPGGRSPQGGRAADGGRRMRDEPQGDRPNMKTESLGRQTIEGIPAEGRRTTVTIPAGAMGNEQPMQSVSESWYSSELQIVVLSKRSDPRTGDSVTRYTNINRTEPLHTLFEIPADYKVSESGGGRGTRGAVK